MFAVICTIMATSVVAPAVAGPGKGGGQKPGGGTMPGPSAFGLCTAYFSGSDTGREHKRNAPPFQDLVAKAEAADQSIEEFCAAQTPGGK